MKIELKKITICELVKGYVDDPERGVSGYGGRLDIRPEYQREFVYKEKDRDAVIRTVMRGFPLNVMYWAKKKDGTFEVMDGQQRTISICQYVAGDFAWGDLELGKKYFHRQPEDIQKKFLDYELMVYLCEGEESSESRTTDFRLLYRSTAQEHPLDAACCVHFDAKPLSNLTP